MSKKFAVGDRVAFYNNAKQMKAFIVEVSGDLVTLHYPTMTTLKGGSGTVVVDRRQCRHLRKKEKPIKFKCEWELSIAGPIFPTAKNLRETLEPLIGKQTRVTIEVLK